MMIVVVIPGVMMVVMMFALATMIVTMIPVVDRHDDPCRRDARDQRSIRASS
ncbi:MAG TPA: hypothetical protein VIM11_14410 [Tepidisphaeraceae bacterium]|jgi:hypothetical protein